jgi:hypothetical protein
MDGFLIQADVHDGCGMVVLQAETSRMSGLRGPPARGSVESGFQRLGVLFQRAAAPAFSFKGLAP